MISLPYRSWTLNFQTSLPLKSKQPRTPVPRKAQTCVPSVDGEGAAEFPSVDRALRFPFPISFFHKTSPAVLTQIKSSASSSSAGEVRKIRSPQTTGVEPARFGSGSRHARFSVLLNLTGTFVSRLMPSRFAPRHSGQLSPRAAAPVVTAASRTITQPRLRIQIISGALQVECILRAFE